MPDRYAKIQPTPPREPLGESAPIAYTLAQKYCDHGDPAESCRYYHSAWQYFRLIGLIKTIASDDDFLVDALQTLASAGQSDRVLISGSADYGMLARVIHAYRMVGREPDVTLVDICRTPLELNLWLAEREGVRIRAVRRDILDFTARQPFDLICTHSFIARFFERRARLTRAWHDLLRPGGCVVTTARIRPEISGLLRFSPRETEAFVNRALELAKNCRELGEEKPERIAEWAREYAQRKLNHPLTSGKTLIDYFTSAGLHPTRIDRVAGSADRPSGPSLGIRSERIRIIATRP
jgi:SAM-dependent methyltransferase